MTHTSIASLHVYPVKSCRGVAVDESVLLETGLVNDRQWMVVDETGRYVSQREASRLALVVPRIDQGRLSLSAPGMADLHLPADAAGAGIEVTVLSDRLQALDAGPEAEAWLSGFLDMAVRLVRFDPEARRSTNPAWGGVDAPVHFPDAFPLLFISQASLDDLNSRLATPVPMNRFRPNVVLDGLEAFDEDRIDRLTAGDLDLRMVFPCPRCKITTIDQAKGEPVDAEPLATLVSYRASKAPRGVLFGHYAIIERGGGSTLRVGQRLELSWKA